MSLINKMLQDLDARHGRPSGLSNPSGLHTAPVAGRGQRTLMLTGVAVGVAALLTVGGWFGWRYWQVHRASAAVAQTAPLPVAALQAPAVAPAPSPVPVAVTTHAPATAPVAVANQAPVVSAPPVAVPAAVVAGHPRHVAPLRPETDKPQAVAVMRRKIADGQAPHVVNHISTSLPTAPAASGTVRIDMDPAQVAQNAYRRAVVALQDGRVSEAMVNLEQSLEVDPRNDAARQTYVSLLLEHKRPDDAVRQLRLALGINPRQPGMAMLLARLQLERDGPALETLLRTQPYAGSNADYQGFLAGVLQRKQRHAEAIERYQDALKLAPERSVWWMGLGISLQAEKRLPAAREAFNRARVSGSLTPELQLFVERKLEQLGR